MPTDPACGFLSIDAGTGGVKCVVYDDEGNLVYRDSRPIKFFFDGDAIEFDFNAVWLDIVELTRNAHSHCSKRSIAISALSSSSMREGNLFYDSSGRELLAVPNLDARAKKESDQISSTLGELIYEKSGHWPSPIFLISRLKWLARNKKQLYSKITRFSMINDWILFKFSGIIASEPTNGCETAIFDLHNRWWSEEIIREAKINPGLFPDIQECGNVIGQISEKASKLTGLSTSIPVVTGAADTEAAVTGCGGLGSTDVVAVAGTTTPVQAVTSNVKIDKKRRTWSCCHTSRDKWIIESNAGATGLVLKWWASQVGRSFDELDQEVVEDEETGRANQRVSVNIGTSLMNAKHMHPLSGTIQGISPWTPRARITRAIIETNCFSVRANLEQIENVLGRRFRQVHFCGGAAASDLWTRIQVDVLDRTLIRHRMAEATARGTAILSAHAVGRFKSLEAAAGSFLKGSQTLKPETTTAKKYKEKFRSWLEEYI